jgi:hypothetical protein
MCPTAAPSTGYRSRRHLRCRSSRAFRFAGSRPGRGSDLFESWLERDHVLHLDFDPSVVSVSSQPFWLHWTDAAGTVSHAPDFFARRTDGSAVVVDCRPVERRRPRDVAKFDATALALRAGRVGVSAAGCGGCARDGEPAVVGRLPASPPPSA